MTLLANFAGQYALARDLSPQYKHQLKWAVDSLEKWAKRKIHLGDLTDDLVNQWIDDRLAEGKSRETIRTQRGALLAIWREAHFLNKTQLRPQRVKKIRGDRPIPRAFAEQQLRDLLAACDDLHGQFRGWPMERSKAMRAFVLLGYYSGLRVWSDLLEVTYEAITPEGVLVWQQHKTSVPISRKLPADCLAAIRAIGSVGRIFPVDRKPIYYWWSKVIDVAGLNGPPKWLRRCGATAVEKVSPGSAMAFLGHKTAGLAYRHYVDLTQLQQTTPTPPML